MSNFLCPVAATEFLFHSFRCLPQLKALDIKLPFLVLPQMTTRRHPSVTAKHVLLLWHRIAFLRYQTRCPAARRFHENASGNRVPNLRAIFLHSYRLRFMPICRTELSDLSAILYLHWRQQHLYLPLQIHTEVWSHLLFCPLSQ